jgi:5-methyltetrahydrofolate--homocysteine methyltransferase
MVRTGLKERIAQGVFLLDGAMGTQLFARGVEGGKCSDYLNIEQPQLIVDIHKSYVDAGSDAVITNTFGANRYALARHGHSEMAAAINTAGAEIARKAAGEQRYVLGDIGPSGDFLEPLGMLKADDLREAFAEQAAALLKGGVDGFIVETMTALDETALAVEAVKTVCELPVFVSLSFDKAGDDFRTMMGVDVASFVSQAAKWKADAAGFNCGTMGLADYVELAAEFIRLLRSAANGLAVLAEPNAGKPELVDGRTVYKVTPEEFAAAAEKIHRSGVNILGGCCGTTPAHIAAVKKILRQ